MFFFIFFRCTKDWNLSELNEKEKDLLYQCKDIEPITLVDDIEEIIQNSKKFPIKFPIDTIRSYQCNNCISSILFKYLENFL